jgi:DNA-binding ferritin-like protein (Dps family)
MQIKDKKKEEVKYKNLVEQLPNEYRNEYHRLLQFGAMYIIGMNFAKRGREGKIYSLFDLI